MPAVFVLDLSLGGSLGFGDKAAWQNVPDGPWAANQAAAILQIRAEWVNAFNRLRIGTTGSAPITIENATAAPTQSALGQYTGGFGTINPLSGTGGQRSGRLIARIQF